MSAEPKVFDPERYNFSIRNRVVPAQLEMISEIFEVAASNSPLVRKLSTINAQCLPVQAISRFQNFSKTISRFESLTLKKQNGSSLTT